MLLDAILLLPLATHIGVWSKSSTMYIPTSIGELTENSIVLLHRIDPHYIPREPLVNYMRSRMGDKVCRGVITKVHDYEDISLFISCKGETRSLPNMFHVDGNETLMKGADIWEKHLSLTNLNQGYTFKPLQLSTPAIGCRYENFRLRKDSERMKLRQIHIQIVETKDVCMYGLPANHDVPLLSMCQIQS